MQSAAHTVAKERLATWVKDWKRHPRPGPKGRDDSDYALIARAYTEHLGDRRPIHALAQTLHLSIPQARNLVYEARKRDLLTPASPGSAGGELTPKATRLLEAIDRGTR
jgi:hypothetical protein